MSDNREIYENKLKILTHNDNAKEEENKINIEDHNEVISNIDDIDNIINDDGGSGGGDFGGRMIVGEEARNKRFGDKYYNKS